LIEWCFYRFRPSAVRLLPPFRIFFKIYVLSSTLNNYFFLLYFSAIVTRFLGNKPTDVGKFSHGSVSGSSLHIPAIGGINKDTNSLIFSPHSNLQ
jgi:hypothetical protein